jgi:hypothetical protein
MIPARRRTANVSFTPCARVVPIGVTAAGLDKRSGPQLTYGSDSSLDSSATSTS